MEITVFEQNGLLSKRISLGPDGIVPDGSACVMSKGWAFREALHNLEDLASLLESLTSSQAIALGALIGGGLRNRVVSKRELATGRCSKRTIARTQKHLGYEPGREGLLLIDFDRKGMPADIAEKIQLAGGFFECLAAEMPSLAKAARVYRASTSSGLSNAITGERYSGSGGEHHYLHVADAADVPRAIRNLHDRLWLLGLGWFTIGAAGQLLDRSLIDPSVGGPERLIFEGAPELVAPLVQDQVSRKPIIFPGEVLDTRVAIPPLTPAEKIRLEMLKRQAREILKPAMTKKRTAADRQLAEQVAAKQGMTVERATRIVARRHLDELCPQIMLVFDDPELGDVPVREVLRNPERYVDETLADPLEGLGYGRCKAKVMRFDDCLLHIHSFAHGRAIYRLVHDSQSIEALIKDHNPAELLDVIAPAVANAYLEPDEIERIATQCAKKIGTTPKPVKQRFKIERDKQLSDARVGSESDHRSRSCRHRRSTASLGL